MLSLGAADWATGGTGADQFELTVTEAGATITDFDRSTDQLWVLYDPASHPDPDVTVIEDGPDAVVQLDGQPLARLVGGAGLTPDALGEAPKRRAGDTRPA